MKKVYFPQNGGVSTEQNLVQDLVDEQIKLFGTDVFYIPRVHLKDKTLGEVIQSENGKLSISTDSMGEIEIPSSNSEYANRSPIWVAIRPEKLKPVFTAPGDLSNVMQGVMGPSAYLGDRSHFYVHLSKREEPVLVALQNLERSIDQLRGPNQKVWLKWSTDAMVVLPRD